jgi:tyrosine-protein kinase Etk/Wzc
MNVYRPSGSIDEAGEITLLDYWRVIQKRRKIILAIFFLGTVSAAVISLLMTPIYQAKTTLMPVESSQSRLATFLGPLQDIPLVGGAMGGSWAKNATDKLIAILKSRTVTEDVIRSLDLIKVIFRGEWDAEQNKWKTEDPPTLQDCVKALQQGIVKVMDDRKGLISIVVESDDPKTAAAISIEYPKALQKFLTVSAISLAKRNRIFLQKQLELTKQDLTGSEENLKKFQTRKKVAVLDVQAEAGIKALAELKAQVIAREVQLGALSEFATRNHPDFKRIEDELREFRQQLKNYEDGVEKPKKNSLGAFISLAEAPTVGLEYGRLKRDTLIQEKVFELLTQQFELAKIEEAKDDITFQIIDAAVAPEKRIRPKRTLNVIVGGLASLSFGVFLAFFLEYLGRQKSKQFGRTEI